MIKPILLKLLKPRLQQKGATQWMRDLLHGNPAGVAGRLAGHTETRRAAGVVGAGSPFDPRFYRLESRQRATTNSIPIVVVSACGVLPDDAVALSQAQVAKPFDLEDLLGAVRAVLGG